ncbi:dephospho-CoA kinase [Trichothermofontia sp.]
MGEGLSALNPQQRRIGLTGGIATGKTTVADFLAAAHIPVLDADVYAREAVQPGTEVLARIRDRYGATILQADGTLDRQRLGDVVFQDARERQWLEQQIHPYVRDRFLTALTTTHLTTPTLALAIPLLFEAKMTDLVTEIWVVTCTPTQQTVRLMDRNQLSLEQALARIQSQWDLAVKVKQADVVLDNTTTLENLWPQVQAALDR